MGRAQRAAPLRHHFLRRLNLLRLHRAEPPVVHAPAVAVAQVLDPRRLLVPRRGDVALPRPPSRLRLRHLRVVVPAHPLGALLDLLAHVPERPLVRQTPRVAVAKREGVEAGHDAGGVAVALRAGDGKSGFAHRPDALEDPVAGVAVELVQWHGYFFADLAPRLLSPFPLTRATVDFFGDTLRTGRWWYGTRCG